jgi:uncharacterized 2Fe-2S/4Fe-4S cluster protein (DUF4445 family)
VTLLPSGQVAEAQTGELLHDIIERTGQNLILPCGGQGRCGRCIVRVQEGPVRRRSVIRLTPEQVAQGYALACQTLVEGDVVVDIPSQEMDLIRPESTPAAGKAAPLVVSCAHRSAPWIEKHHLTIAPPSLDDNTTDWERLKRELARTSGLRELDVSLPLLKNLARTLRQAQWDVTAVLERGTWIDPEATPRLLDVRPGDATARTLGLAIDIGTTSVVVYLADLASGKLIDRASAYNAQVSCGEDVISRIIYAKRQGGLENLQQLVVQTINGLIDELMARYSYAADEIYQVTVAGNTTMILSLIHI